MPRPFFLRRRRNPPRKKKFVERALQGVYQDNEATIAAYAHASMTLASARDS
jgi:hypothetical protein